MSRKVDECKPLPDTRFSSQSFISIAMPCYSGASWI
jgi:hypothetical protein